nr:hypothetical protein [Kibdelosporangium sp. MJ126-NF4]CTQ95902.1 hypothetical protein [Kibdelosporangium sp. MJ126-NF4]
MSLAVVAVMAATACTNPVSGQPQAKVAPGTIEATFLPLDEVSALVGTTLAAQQSVSEPPRPLSADPPVCAVAVGPATVSVYARGWRSFGSVSYQDSSTEHVVTQVLGVYPDETGAKAAFETLSSGLAQCPTAVRANPDRGMAKWSYKVDTTVTDSVGWTASQDGGDGWACARQARRKGNALIQVSVCQAGDGKPAAAAILDKFAGRVTS